MKQRPISFFADSADSDDLLEGPGDPLLPAGDVQARRRDRIVRPTLEVSAVVDHLEECVGALHNGLRQVDSVRHVGYGSESIDERSVRAALRLPVVVEGVTGAVEGGSPTTRTYHSREITAAEECVLRASHPGPVLPALLVRECPPLRTNIDNSVSDNDPAV